MSAPDASSRRVTCCLSSSVTPRTGAAIRADAPPEISTTSAAKSVGKPKASLPKPHRMNGVIMVEQIIALRRAHPALNRGEIEWLHNRDERRVVTFFRRGGNEELLVAINFSNLAFSGTVEVKDAGSFADITPRAQVASPRTVEAQLPTVTLGPWGYRIFHRAAR